jgi:hypothetical protein
MSSLGLIDYLMSKTYQHSYLMTLTRMVVAMHFLFKAAVRPRITGPWYVSRDFTRVCSFTKVLYTKVSLDVYKDVMHASCLIK